MKDGAERGAHHHEMAAGGGKENRNFERGPLAPTAGKEGRKGNIEQFATPL